MLLLYNWRSAFDKHGEMQQRFLPAEVAGFFRDHSGDTGLCDIQFRAAGDGFELYGNLHGALQVRIVENIGVAHEFVRHQFDIFAAEGVTVTVAELSEGHFESAADFRFKVEDFAQVTIRRQPASERVRIEKGFVNEFGLCFEHAMEMDGMSVHDAC